MTTVNSKLVTLRKAALIAATSSLALLISVTPATAQSQSTGSVPQQINLPQRSLRETITAISMQFKVPVIVSDEIVDNLTAPAISGNLTVEQALAMAFEGTGLIATLTDSGGVHITQRESEKAAPEDLQHMQNVIDEDGILRVGEVTVVRGTSRLPDAIELFPGTVRIIEKDEFDAFSAVNSDLGSVLGNYVPGFSPSGSQTSASNVDQTLRGRIPSVFIDGVPITTTLRNGRTDIRSLHASVIDRLEIVSGSSTLYGNGGAGGIINYVTGRAEPGSDVSFTSKLGSRMSLTHAGDSLNPYFTQTARGDLGLVDFIGSATLEKTQSYFDADGERIAPNPNLQLGLADSIIQNYFGKIGFEKEGQRLEISALYYDQTQDTDFIGGVGDIALGQPVPAIKGGKEPGEVDQGVETSMLNMVYTHSDLVPETVVRAQAYALQFDSVFSYSTFFPEGGQSFVKSDKHGARFDFDTDLNFLLPTGGRLLYGVDYLKDTSEQPLIDGRTFVPEVRQENTAFFAQVELPVTDRFTVSGGLRYEDFNVDVETFQALFSGATVTGGEIGFSETTHNMGASYELVEGLRAFAGFSQGAPVAEIGRVLRSASEDIDIATFNLAPSITDSYEIGLRFVKERLQAEVVYYQNESTLGSTTVFDEDTGEFIVARAPEEVQGFEASVDYQFTSKLRAGGSFAWIEGDRDTDNNGSTDQPLSGQAVPPEKLALFAEYDGVADWFLRGQLSYVGNRNEFPESTRFGEGEVNSRVVADVFAKRAVGSGILQLGIHNLFNTDYFTHTSEIMQLPDSYSKAPGATLSVEYTIEY